MESFPISFCVFLISFLYYPIGVWCGCSPVVLVDRSYVTFSNNNKNDDISNKNIENENESITKNNITNNPLQIGFEVIPTNKIEEYYGFTLNGDGRYLLEDFTVTHNSLLLNNMAVQTWMQDNIIHSSIDYSGGN